MQRRTSGNSACEMPALYAREDEVWLNKLKAHLISPCGEAHRKMRITVSS